MTLDLVFYGLALLLAAWLIYSFLLRGKLSDAKAARLLEEGALVIDVRNPDEFSEVHVEGAVNIPLPNLMFSIKSMELEKQAVLLCHCKSGGRSAIAVTLFRNAGYKKAYNLGSLKRALAMQPSDQ